MVHAITFSIPDEKVCKHVPKKEKILAHIIPSDASTYIFKTEKAYYEDYQKSYFAITKKKAGWDCLRHYEIIANGCIPVFLDIEKCPRNTMALLPKDLLAEANKLYARIGGKSIHEIDTAECDALIEKFMSRLMTTEKITKYILNTINKDQIKKVLFLSGRTDPDYLRCLTLHGFKTTFGKDCHDFPKVPHIYKDCTTPDDRLYGRGFTYTKLIDAELHTPQTTEDIVRNIAGRNYDIVVYGSYHRGMPLLDVVKKHYRDNEIVLLCGEDIHQCNHMIFNSYHTFVRELTDS